MATEFDAIVIGTGQAGPALAARMAKEGLRVAVVERNLTGGTCVNTGCTPTKTLVASARVAHLARRAADFGVDIEGPVRVDMKRVKARMDRVVAASRNGLEKWLGGEKNIRFIHGHARFVSSREIQAGEERLAAPKIFLDIGGRANVPPISGLEQAGYLTNVSMLDLDIVPERLVIIGGSYVGLEFAQMYRRFGSDVTVIERGPRIIPREDEHVPKAVHEILEKESVRILVNTECTSAAREDGEIRLEFHNGGTRCTHLLLASGRRPNTGDLGLDAAGVRLDPHGYIAVDDQLRTSAEGIWALGDCNGRGAFTHTAYNDYEIVAANLFDNDPRRVSDRIPTYALYIDPPLGRAGMTETQVRQDGRPALSGMRPMTRVSRAVEKGETQGFMQVLVDRGTKQILGAAILGPGGDEAIHCVLDIMSAKAPYTTLRRTMHIHPTVAELIPTVLGELQPLP